MINKFSRIQKIIFAGAITVFLFFLFSQTIIGERIYFPGWAMGKMKNFLSENELSAKDYKDGTIILIKPVATGVGDGRYEAGDIAEIRDGEALYQRFGNGNFLGKEEKTKLLPLYYPGKLTEEEKQQLLEPEVEITNPKTQITNKFQIPNSKPDEEKIIKRRKVGVDYTKFLSNSEIIKVRQFEKLDRIPEIDLSSVIEKMPEQKSVVHMPQHLTKLGNFRNKIEKLARKILPFAHAGTGGTKTICTSGCDYTTLNLWEAGEQGILVEPAIAQITEGFQDTTAVIIDGWTTSAANYIYIHTSAAARHAGVYNTSKYRLEVAGANAIVIQEENTRIDGLQVSVAPSANLQRCIRVQTLTAAANIYISNNILRMTATGSYTSLAGINIYDTASNSNVYVWNNIIYDALGASGSGIKIDDAQWTAYWYNNTVYGCYYGYNQATGTVTATNNISYGNTDNYTGTIGGDYNLSGPVQTDAPGDNSQQAASLTFVSAGTDFHLVSTDTNAIGKGTDNPGSGLYSDDIDGVARTSVWDIGADEYVVVTPPVPASGGTTPKTRIKGNVRIKGGVEFR